MSVLPYKIGIITISLNIAGIKPLSNLINIFCQLSDQFSLVTGNEGYLLFKDDTRIGLSRLDHTLKRNKILHIIFYLYNQLNSCYYIIKLYGKVNMWIFFRGEYSTLPIFTAILLHKTVLLYLAGSEEIEEKCVMKFPRLITKNLVKISYFLSSDIILYSTILIGAWNLSKYSDKIRIAHHHFLDFGTFTVTTPLHDRSSLIGYIGRLSTEKGVQHFAQALPAILRDHKDFRVLIGGDGYLKEAVEASLQEGGVADNVDLPGWIANNDLPIYLNQLRLLVLPSYTEGLPNIILEAMACGTPVLATPVGVIPDIIKDGETGFIMENNSPECIAENVLRALSSPDLERIAEKGRWFVEANFTLEHVIDRWKEVLKDI